MRRSRVAIGRPSPKKIAAACSAARGQPPAARRSRCRTDAGRAGARLGRRGDVPLSVGRRPPVHARHPAGRSVRGRRHDPGHRPGARCVAGHAAGAAAGVSQSGGAVAEGRIGPRGRRCRRHGLAAPDSQQPAQRGDRRRPALDRLAAAGRAAEPRLHPAVSRGTGNARHVPALPRGGGRAAGDLCADACFPRRAKVWKSRRRGGSCSCWTARAAWTAGRWWRLGGRWAA